MLIKIIFILKAITISLSINFSQESEKVISVEGNVNQSTKIIIPFNHLVSATISEKQYQDYLVFSPNRFRLQISKLSQTLPRVNKNLLQQLTTPFTNDYIHIFKLNNHFCLFKMPNHFIILKENANNYQVTKDFTIPEMIKKSIKFQMINDQLLTIYLPQNKIIFLTFNSYSMGDNSFNTTNVIVSKQIQDKNKGLNIAYYNNRMYEIEVLNKSIRIKSQVNLSTIVNFRQIKIILVEQGVNEKILWIVDEIKGLIWVEMSKNNQIQTAPIILLNYSGCYELDIQIDKPIRVILTCSSHGAAIFVKALFLYENHKPILIKEWKPHIQNCKTKKFMFYKEHIFSLQKQSLDIFLPSIYKEKKDLFYIKNQISLSDHSAYWISQDLQKDKIFIYSVTNFTFTKSQLILEEYTLQIKSDKDLLTKFNLSIEYICSDSSFKVKQICKYDCTVEVNIHNKYLSFQQIRSINIGIMFLFVTTIITVSYICYVKYRTIQYKLLKDLKQITNPTDIKL